MAGPVKMIDSPYTPRVQALEDSTIKAVKLEQNSGNIQAHTWHMHTYYSKMQYI